MATKSKAKKATKAPAKKIATKKQFPPAHHPDVKAKAIQRARELKSAAKAAAELKLPPKTVEGWLTVANKKDKAAGAPAVQGRLSAAKTPAKRANATNRVKAPKTAKSAAQVPAGSGSPIVAQIVARIAELEGELRGLRKALVVLRAA